MLTQFPSADGAIAVTLVSPGTLTPDAGLAAMHRGYFTSFYVVTAGTVAFLDAMGNAVSQSFLAGQHIPCKAVNFTTSTTSTVLGLIAAG